MNLDDELVRLSLEGSGSSSAVRSALEAAKRDLPSAEHVDEMFARFPFPGTGDLGGGGADAGGGAGGEGAAGGAAPDASLSAGGDALPVGSGGDAALGAGAAGASVKLASTFGGAKLLAALAIGALGAGAIVVANRTDQDGATSTSSPEAASAFVANAPSAVALQQGTSAATPTSSAQPEATAKTRPAAPAHPSSTASASSAASAAAPARSEMEILKDAQAAKRSNPAQALAFVDEHARSHPRGAMGQEREMIRIESLVLLGRKQEAQALADAFRKSNPGSAYAQRLDALLPPTK